MLIKKEKRKSVSNFKLNCSIRRKANRACKSLNNKMNTIIGCSNYHLREWIIYQLYGLMTLENCGNIWCLDHCIPLKKSNENDLYNYTNSITLRPMYLKDIISKFSATNYHLYLLQEMKAKCFLKLNNDQERFNEKIH